MMTTIILYTVNQVDHYHPTHKGYMDNPLWDRQGCHSSSDCCDNRLQPWLWQILSEMTESDSNINVR